jgi:hypothetical protein
MSHAPTPDLASRVDRLKDELAAELSRTRRSTFLTGLVGAIALIALFAYFAFGYMKFEEATQPQRLVDVAQTVVNDNLPEARKSLEAEVVRSAPVWAEGLSKQTLAALPDARAKLEDYVMTQVDTSLKQGTVLTEDRFRTFLRQNQDKLRKDLEELGSSPELAEQSLASLEMALEEQLEGDMKAQAHDLFAALEAVIAKLQRYKDGTDLNRSEQAERQVLLLFRRLQHEQVGGMPPPPDSALSARGMMSGPPPSLPKASDDQPSTAAPEPSRPPGAELRKEEGPTGAAPDAGTDDAEK